MKKIFLVLATFAVVGFAACGNQTQAGSTNDTDTVVMECFVEDTVSVDTVVAE